MLPRSRGWTVRRLKRAGAGLLASQPGPLHEDAVGPTTDGPKLGWVGLRPFVPDEADRLREAARFAAAPLATLTARATSAQRSKPISAGAARRACCSVRCGAASARPSRRRSCSPTCAASPHVRKQSAHRGHLRPRRLVRPHRRLRARFGGEVLKFMGDSVLAIFPVVGGSPRHACDAALKAVGAARSGMAHLDQARRRDGLPPCPSAFRCISARCCGAISARRPTRLHRHRPGRQSGQPARGTMPPARQGRPHFGGLRRRDAGAARSRWVKHASARHRRALRRLHLAGSAPVGARSQHDDRRSLRDPPVEIDYVGVHHPDASGRHCLADRVRLIGPVDAE